MAEDFWAHNVDSWVIANAITNGHTAPENLTLYRIIPMQMHRRQLHRFKPDKGGVRKPYGGTMSMGYKRGSIVNHTRFGMVYIGGTMSGKVSLHNVVSGKRLTQSGSVKDCDYLYRNSWRAGWVTCK